MRATRLGTKFACIIAAGILTSSGVWALSSQETEEHGFDPFVVPVASDLDEFEYAGLGTYEETENGVQSSGNWTYRLATRLLGMTQAPDEYGAIHGALRYAVDELGSIAAGNGTLEFPNGYQVPAEGLLDLTSRDCLAGARGVERTFQGRCPARSALHGLLRWQGMRIEPGAVLPEDPLTAHWEAQGRWLDFEETCIADREGAIGKKMVVGVRCASEGGWRDQDGQEAGRFSVEEVYWLHRKAPYPLRIDSVSESSGPAYSYVDQWSDSLVRVERYGEPVAWETCSEMPHFQETNPDVERTQGPAAPSSGSQPALGYPMDLARASVQADSTLTDYHAWRESHPDAVLITALYQRFSEGHRSGGTPVSASHQWHFVEWSPDGTGFRVESSRLTSGQAVNRDRACGIVVPTMPLPTGQICGLTGATLGQLDLAFEVDELPLPDAPVSIAAAHKMAGTIAPPELHQAGVTMLSWGPVQNDWFQESMPDVGPWDFDTITLRYGDAATPYNYAYEADEDYYVTIDVEKGAMEQGWSFTGDASEPLDLVTGDAPPAPVDERPPADRASIPFWLVPTAGGSAMLLASILLFVGPWIRDLFAAVVTGYAKIRGDALLDHPLRRQIHVLLASEPGLNATQIHAHVGGGWSTVIFHLRKLTSEGLLVRVRDGRHRRFFVVGKKPPDEMGRLVTLHNRGTRQAYEELQRSPGISRGHVARRLGMSVPGALWHLDRLEASGLARRRREGRTVLYEPAGLR